MVSMRAKTIEEERLALVPGTTTDRCHRCGEKIVLSPGMLKELNRSDARLWCWECLWELHPSHINFVQTREMIFETLLVQRLERQIREGGPIH